jgi:hypothetical protein
VSSKSLVWTSCQNLSLALQTSDKNPKYEDLLKAGQGFVIRASEISDKLALQISDYFPVMTSSFTLLPLTQPPTLHPYQPAACPTPRGRTLWDAVV